MKLITQDTDYAVRVLIALARKPEETVPVSDLVTELGISRPFLRKICQVLSRNHLLESRKGRGGGFTLAKPPENIHLTDIIEMFRGPFTFEKCIFVKKLCPNRTTCVLRRELEDIEAYARSKLESITVGYLMKPEKGKD